MEPPPAASDENSEGTTASQALNPGMAARLKAAFQQLVACGNGSSELSRETLAALLKKDEAHLEGLQTNEGGGVGEAEWLQWFEVLAGRGGDAAASMLSWVEECVPQESFGTPMSVFTPPTPALMSRGSDSADKTIGRAQAAFDAILSRSTSTSNEVTKAELMRVLRKDKLAAKVLFKELDENLDGGISKTEWTRWFNSMLSKGEGDEEAVSQLEWIEEALRRDTPDTPSLEPDASVILSKANEPRERVVARAKAAFQQILEKSGKNDGEVSKIELTQVLRKDKLAAKVLFKELDENSDGGISETEWLRWFNAMIVRSDDEAESQLEWIDEALRRDTPDTPSLEPDASAILSKANEPRERVVARAKAAFQQILEKSGKNDGEVSKIELTKVLRKDKLAAKVLFKELDENSDGGISETEWLRWFNAMLVRSNDEAESQLEWIEQALVSPADEIQSPLLEAATPNLVSQANEPRERTVARATEAFRQITEKCSSTEVSKEQLTKVLRKDKLAAKILFKELDENSDGDVSLEEWLRWFDAMLVRSDDEAESQLEWIEEALHSSAPSTPEEEFSNTVAQRALVLNAAHDAIRRRAASTFTSILAKARKENDEVTREELMRVLRKDKLAAKVIFKELDENLDGGISETEWLRWFNSMLARSDDEAESQLEWIEEALNQELPATPLTEAQPPPVTALQANEPRERVVARAKAAFQEILEKSGKNDGEVSKIELTKVLRKDKLAAKVLFKELDENSDGGISETEWLCWFNAMLVRSDDEAESQLEWIEQGLSAGTASATSTPLQPPLDPTTATSSFSSNPLGQQRARLDAVLHEASKAFHLIDASDGNGELSREEILDAFGADRLAAKVLFKELDENIDGGISIAEWNAWFNGLYTRKGVDEAESAIAWITEVLSTGCAATGLPSDPALSVLDRAASDTFSDIALNLVCPEGSVRHGNLLLHFNRTESERVSAESILEGLTTDPSGCVTQRHFVRHFREIAAKRGPDEAARAVAWLKGRTWGRGDRSSGGAPGVEEGEAEAREVLERLEAANRNTLHTGCVSVWGTPVGYGTPQDGKSCFACIFFGSNSLSLPKTRREEIAKHIITPLSGVPDATPDTFGVSPAMQTVSGGPPRLFDPSSIDPLHGFPTSKRLAGCLLAKLGRVPSPGDTVHGIPSAELQPPLWQQSDLLHEIAINGGEVDSFAQRSAGGHLPPPSDGSSSAGGRGGKPVGVRTALPSSEGGGGGGGTHGADAAHPTASALYGGKSFVITPCELADMESTLRATLNEAELPRLFYALLLARFTAHRMHAAHFAVRKTVPLADLFSNESDAKLLSNAQNRLQNARRRLGILKQQGRQDPFDEDMWQQEQFAAYNKDAVRVLQQQSGPHRQGGSPKWTLAASFHAFLDEVRGDPLRFGFESSNMLSATLERSLQELSSAVVISQRGFSMVHSRFQQYQGSIGPKTRKSIAFVMCSAGIDLCGAEATAMEAPKYFQRAAQPEHTPPHIGFSGFLPEGVQALRRRIRAMFESVFEALRVQGVKYASLPPLGVGDHLSNLTEADARRVTEIYFEEQFDLLCHSGFGLQCCYIQAADETQFRIAFAALRRKFHHSLSSGAGQHYIRCAVALHCKNPRHLSQALAEEGQMAGLVIPSDSEALLQGCIGTYWEKGLCMEYSSAEDSVCSSTIATSAALGPQIGARALATSLPSAGLVGSATPTKTVRIPLLTPGGEPLPLGIHFVNEVASGGVKQVRIYSIQGGSPAEQAGAVHGVLMEASGVLIRSEADFISTVGALRLCSADHVELHIAPDETGLGLLSKAVQPLDDLNATLQEKLIFLPPSPSYYHTIENPRGSLRRSRATAPAATPGSQQRDVSPSARSPPGGVECGDADASAGQRGGSGSAGASYPGNRYGFLSSVPREPLSHHAVTETPAVSPGPGAYRTEGERGVWGRFPSPAYPNISSGAAPRLRSADHTGPGPGEYDVPRQASPAVCSPPRLGSVGGVGYRSSGGGGGGGGGGGSLPREEKGLLVRDAVRRIAPTEKLGPGPGEYNVPRWLE